jgi:hypothetical protein
MLDLRRSLIMFAAVAAAVLLVQLTPASEPIPLAPAVVEAFPELAPPESIAALLVSPEGEDGFGGASRRETALLLDVIHALDDVPERSGRTAALEEIASMPALDSAVVAALARASTRLSSSSNRQRLLRSVIRRQPYATSIARRDVLDAIGALRSSGDRASALETFVRQPELSDEALIEALMHVPRLSSNGDRSRVLVAAARSHRIGGRARTVYVRTANGISRGRDRARALEALGRGGDEGDQPGPDGVGR